MAILIDGYNLLHVTGVFAEATGPGSLQKLHQAFISFLATTLDPADVPQTTVVFDAKGRHAGSRRTFRFGDLTVHYAARHEDADTVLAELITSHSAPRRLVVVSSDHQVQRAARRRRAKAVDSNVWYAELIQCWRSRKKGSSRIDDVKPATPLSQDEVARWVQVFISDEPSPDAGSSREFHPAQAVQPSGAIQESGGANETAPATGGGDIDFTESAQDAEDNPFPMSYLAAIERELLSEPAEPRPPKLRKVRESKRRHRS